MPTDPANIHRDRHRGHQSKLVTQGCTFGGDSRPLRDLRRPVDYASAARGRRRAPTPRRSGARGPSRAPSCGSSRGRRGSAARAPRLASARRGRRGRCVARRASTRVLGRRRLLFADDPRDLLEAALRAASSSRTAARRSAARRAARPANRRRVRVSTSSAVSSACSGLMYSGVPIDRADSVNSVCSVSRCAVALAMPKSMTFGHRLRRRAASTRMFDGLRSRWMIALLMRVLHARRRPATNSSSRSRSSAGAGRSTP